MKKIFLLVLGLHGLSVFGQKAAFYANPFPYGFDMDTSSEHYHYVMQMHWEINGQSLSWFSDTVYIDVDETVDTILFREHDLARTDTLICSISEARNYEFFYNPCCGGFYVRWGEYREWGSVQFSMKHGGKKNYLGRISDTMLILDSDSSNVLSPQCISAMASNIHWVSLYEFDYCVPGENCSEEESLDCLVAYNDGPIADSIPLIPTRKLVEFLYLPLRSEPLKILYDARTGRLTLAY